MIYLIKKIMKQVINKILYVDIVQRSNNVIYDFLGNDMFYYCVDEIELVVYDVIYLQILFNILSNDYNE